MVLASPEKQATSKDFVKLNSKRISFLFFLSRKKSEILYVVICSLAKCEVEALMEFLKWASE